MHLSQLRKAQIVKTYALSKINHIAVIVPTPDSKAIHSIEASIVRFITGTHISEITRISPSGTGNMAVLESLILRPTLKHFNLAG